MLLHVCVCPVAETQVVVPGMVPVLQLTSMLDMQ